MMKILYYDRGGFCIVSKKLTQGQFAFNAQQGGKKLMTWLQLQWLIDGVEFDNIRYRKSLNR